MFKKIKEKIIGFWEFCKRQWKKIVLLIIGGSIIVYAVGLPPLEEIPFVMFNEQKIEFPYTDDNTGENMIIRTDREIYGGLFEMSRAGIWLMIEVPKTQKVDAQLFFSQDDIKLEEFYYVWENLAYSTSSYECGTATSSKQCIEIHNPDERIVISLEDFDQVEYDRLVSDQNLPIKSKNGFKAKKKGRMLLQKGTHYLYAVITYPQFTHAEFFAEFIGDEGGYAHLDPTILADPYDFNACDIEELDTNAGCANWSGNTTFKVTSTVYFNDGGTQAVVNVDGASDETISKSGTLRADGALTVYLRKSSTVAGEQNFKLYEGASYRINTRLAKTANTVDYYNGSAWQNIGNYSADTWVSLQIQWYHSDKTARYNVDEAGWSATDSVHSAWTNGLDTVLLFWRGDSGASGYYDYISETPYSAPTVAPPEMKTRIYLPQ